MSQNPQWSDPKELRLSVTHSMNRLIPGSNMFTIKNGLAAFSKAHPEQPIFDASQGDGGASLGGVRLQELCDAFLRFAKSTSYGLPHGDPRLRNVLLENYWKLDTLSYTPDQIIVCDGGRDALAKWFEAIEAQSRSRGGTLVTSAAPWISYLHGSYLHGMNVLRAPENGELDFKLTPDSIWACDKELNMVPSLTRAIVITTPDNPTGTFYTADEIVRAILGAYRAGFRYILIDLMYQLVIDENLKTYDWARILKMLTPEVRKCVSLLDGLTKSIGASNVRMAHLVCSDPEMATIIKNNASHTVLPNVFGEAAAYDVYSSLDVRNHPWVKHITSSTSQSRAILNTELKARGHKFVSGQGYYAFIDVSCWIGNDQFKTAEELGGFLAREHGIAVVHGNPFHQPNYVRFSYAQAPETTKAAIERFDAALKSLS